jgi:putative oxidoreductase
LSLELGMKMVRYLSVQPSSRFPIALWAPIPLRLIVGYGFLEHGIAKLSRGPDAFAAILQAMGVPDPHLMARLTILIEVLGGFAVLMGVFVAILSVPMTAVLLVAMFKVHLSYGFSSVKLLAVTAAGAMFGPVGYEVNLLYIACLAALVLGGSGPFALDRLLSKRSDKPSMPYFERTSMACNGGTETSVPTEGGRVYRDCF